MSITKRRDHSIKLCSIVKLADKADGTLYARPEAYEDTGELRANSIGLVVELDALNMYGWVCIVTNRQVGWIRTRHITEVL